MTVVVKDKDLIVLAGQCGVEDAEELQRQLLVAPRATVDWSACEALHAAVVQMLLVARPRIRGTPSNAFLENHIAPLLLSDSTYSPR